jgi:hypothetical protein
MVNLFNFRFIGKDFENDPKGWEAAVKWYRKSHTDPTLRYPDSLKIGGIMDHSGELKIDYLIGKMESNRTNPKIKQLCIKTIRLEDEFKFLTKIIFFKQLIRQDNKEIQTKKPLQKRK